MASLGRRGAWARPTPSKVAIEVHPELQAGSISIETAGKGSAAFQVGDLREK
jgi:hypothetical protein